MMMASDAFLGEKAIAEVKAIDKSLQALLPLSGYAGTEMVGRKQTYVSDGLEVLAFAVTHRRIYWARFLRVVAHS
jgi:hypothetical protein